MKFTLIVAIACSVLIITYSAVVINNSNSSKDDDAIQTHWHAFKSKYNKKYADPDYEQFRIQIFSENLKIIQQDTKNFGITKFMDLTPKEFKERYLTLIVDEKKAVQNVSISNQSIKNSIDWRQLGAVTPVIDQGVCGSSWAFAATGGIEGAHFNKSNELLTFSAQYILDCSDSYGNYGCSGGQMTSAFQCVIDNGIPTESAYQYTGLNQQCKMQKGPYKISSWVDVKAGDADDLISKLNLGPVSVAVDATKWQLYSQGIFNNCDKQINHGALAVGYTSDAIIVKNQWGTSWGENGYIRLTRGNTCGIALSASIPFV